MIHSFNAKTVTLSDSSFFPRLGPIKGGGRGARGDKGREIMLFWGFSNLPHPLNEIIPTPLATVDWASPKLLVPLTVFHRCSNGQFQR